MNAFWMIVIALCVVFLGMGTITWYVIHNLDKYDVEDADFLDDSEDPWYWR